MRTQLECWSLNCQECLPLNRDCDCIYWASSRTSVMTEELWIRRSKHAKKGDRRNWVGLISGSTECCVKHGTSIGRWFTHILRIVDRLSNNAIAVGLSTNTTCSRMRHWTLPSVGDSRAYATLMRRRHHSSVVELLIELNFIKLMRVMRSIVQQEPIFGALEFRMKVPVGTVILIVFVLGTKRAANQMAQEHQLRSPH